eukprot:1175806-Prorocentrum_minimum.AAC.1
MARRPGIRARALQVSLCSSEGGFTGILTANTAVASAVTLAVVLTASAVLTTDPLGVGRMGIFSRRTNRTQDVRVYSHGGPIGRRTC